MPATSVVETPLLPLEFEVTHVLVPGPLETHVCPDVHPPLLVTQLLIAEAQFVPSYPVLHDEQVVLLTQLEGAQFVPQT